MKKIISSRLRMLIEMFPYGHDIFLFVNRKRMGISYRGFYSTWAQVVEKPDKVMSDYDLVNQKKVIIRRRKNQYSIISSATNYKKIILWFDACLFDQSMLAHIMTCLHHIKVKNIYLLCIDSFPGMLPERSDHRRLNQTQYPMPALPVLLRK